MLRGPSAVVQCPRPLLPSMLPLALATAIFGNRHADHSWLSNHSIDPDRQRPLRSCRSSPGAAEQRRGLSTKGGSALSEARSLAACLSLEPDSHSAHQQVGTRLLLETRLKHPHTAKMVSIHSTLIRAVAFLALSATADTTPQQVADDINQLSQKSQALQGTAQSITVLNAPLIVLEEGPFRVCQSSSYFRVVTGIC